MSLKTNESKEKQVKSFKLKFFLMVLVVDAIAVCIVYFIMPLVQNFPPLSEDLQFQEQLPELTHTQQYMIAYALGVSVHTISFLF